MKIAISKASGSKKYENYANWLSAAQEDVTPVDLYTLSKDAALKELEECCGLLLSGGEDVQPELYGKGDEKQKAKETDPWRDELELALIEKAGELKMPILGICRGAQILNVAHGGTLIVDIPSDYGNEITHTRTTEKDGFHELSVAPGTLLKKISRNLEGKVNSAHHQGVEQLPSSFVASAKSPDGIIEAFEWNEPMGKPFLLAVQWHPERLDYDSPFSLPIAKHFIFEAESYKLLGRMK